MIPMQPIEGITPDMIWTALIVILGFCAIWLLVFKVYESFQKIKQNRSINREMPREELANSISEKVLEKLEPRFQEIDRKLANDKETLDQHTRELNQQQGQIDEYERGQKVLCQGTLALLNHAIHDGNDDELVAAQKNLNTYLIEK